MFRPSRKSVRLVALTALVIGLLLTTACAGKHESNATDEHSVVLISSDIAIGEQRMTVGILNSDQEPVVGAKVKVRLFKVAGETGTLAGEGEAHSIKVTQTYTDKHADGSLDTHKAGDVGVYAVYMTFDAPGDYGIEVSGKAGSKTIKPIQLGFKVQAKTASVSVGEPAPKTIQPTLRDVTDLGLIDTSDPPDPDMHSMTVAEAVTSGKPTVIAFATPGFCTSRICGPMKQVIDGLYAKYKTQMNFVHIEPYDLEKARTGKGLEPVPQLAEWGLRTEPWVFVIDRDGKVVAKFEAVAAGPEIDLPLQKLVPSGR